MALIIRRVPKVVEPQEPEVAPWEDQPVEPEVVKTEVVIPAPQEAPAKKPITEEQLDLNLDELQSPPAHEEPNHLNNLMLALKHLSQTKGKALLMVKHSTGEVIHVLKHDPSDKTLVEDSTGRRFKVRLSEREGALYAPLWR